MQQRHEPDRCNVAGAKYRYPGPQEFEDTLADNRRFFGRMREISTVAERIVASRLLVVYGGSGLGKSSLLKAGVFPKLRAENLLPVRVRLNKPSGSVCELLKDACAETARDSGHEFEIDYTQGKGQTAWEFFGTVMFWHGERFVPPILVFDQFEEIFTLADAAWRKEFGREVGPLASGNPPAAVRERLRSRELGLSDQAPNVKLVFCLREEYYGSLQDLSPQFPGLFQDRFRLRALDAKQAELAIVEPARLESGQSTEENFITPIFEYDSSAIESMLDFLRDRYQTIEPVPLQLLCQYVEQVIVEGKRKAGVRTPIVITAGDLGGKNAMNKVIGRFYKDSIDGLPAAERRRARELCDTGLLAATGNRLLLERNQIVKDYKVSDATLRYLTDKRRILREEPRLESTFYEISHDTIARSIFESRKWRLPKQWRRAAVVSVGFMIVLLAIAAWAVVQRNKADVARSNADEATKTARTLAIQAKNSERKANQSLTEAEGMVAFLMGEDFLAKLRPMGRLNVFEDVQTAVPCKAPEKGVEYSDVGLKNLGLACLNEGDIDYAQFRLRDANERYETARLHFAELARRTNDGSDENLAEALFKVARVAEDQLDLDRSLDLTRQSLKLQERLVAGRSSDEKLLRDLANSYLYVGSIREKQGYLREALANFERVIALSREKDSAEWLYIRQDGLAGESEILAQQGYPARSEESAKKAYECAKEAVAKGPFAPEAKYRLGLALSQLPESSNRKPGDLLREYQEVFEDVASAAAWDSENKVWARDLAATHILLGEALVADREWDKAAEQYRTAIPMVERLLELDPTNRQLKVSLLVWVHESLGAAYEEQDPATLGKFLAVMKPGPVTGERETGSSKPAPLQPESKSKDALGELLIAQQLLKPLQEYAPGDVEIRHRAAILAVRAARLQRSENRTGEAIKTCDRALRELVAHDLTDSYYWEYKHQLEAERGEALNNKGEEGKAGDAFQAAAASIDWLLAHFPPNSNEWNDKFLLFYDHIAPFRRSKKDMTGELAGYQEALGAVEKAVLFEPQNAILQYNLALAGLRVGDSLRDSGQFPQAQEHYAASEKALRNAIQLNESADYQNGLFLLFYDHVAALRKQQKDDAAVRKAYQDALAPIVKAVELDPTKPVYQSNLAYAQQAVGDSFRDSAQFPQAQEHYAASEKALRNAIQLNESADYQNGLFLLFYDHVAALRKQQKDDAAVRKAYQDALAAIMKAVEPDPTKPVYQSNLAYAQQAVGDSFRDSGQFPQAQEHYAASEKALRKAIQFNESADYQNGLFLLFYYHVAELHEKQKNDAAVLKAYQDASDAERKAVALAPKVFDYRQNSSLVLWEVGKRQSDKREALETFRLAVRSLHEGMSLLPEGEASSVNRASAQTGLYVILHDHIAPILHDLNDTSGEFSALSEALASARAAASLEKDNAAYQADLGHAHLGIGDFLWQQSTGKTGALESYARAEQAFREAVRLEPAEAWHWHYLAVACKSQGLVQEDKGESLAARTSYRNAMNAIEQAGKLNSEAYSNQFHDDVLKKLGPDK